MANVKLTDFDLSVLKAIRAGWREALATQDLRACKRLCDKGLAKQRGPREFRATAEGRKAIAALLPEEAK